MGVIWWDKLAVLGAFGGRLSADIREKVCNRLTAGRALQKVLICTPTRRGLTFVRAKVSKTRLGRCPKTPTHRNARPESQSDGFPERGLNGAYKVPRRICPLPTSPASGEGNALPFCANR